LRQGGLVEGSTGFQQKVAKLELGRAERLGTGLGGQKTSDPLEQILGLRPQGFDETLGVFLLLLGQGGQNHGNSLPFWGLSWMEPDFLPLVYKESTNFRDAHTNRTSCQNYLDKDGVWRNNAE
jgi:hypothetical protein